LCTSFDGLNLAFIRFAAIDGDNRGGSVAGGEHHVFGDLDGQFAGGDHNQRFHAGFGVHTEGLNEGKAKTEGFAGSRFCLSNNVLAGERNRNGLFLNGERFFNSSGFECLDHVGFDTEVGKIHVLGIPRLLFFISLVVAPFR
jgi:hypothetical protein